MAASRNCFAFGGRGRKETALLFCSSQWACFIQTSMTRLSQWQIARSSVARCTWGVDAMELSPENGQTERESELGSAHGESRAKASCSFPLSRRSRRGCRHRRWMGFRWPSHGWRSLGVRGLVASSSSDATARASGRALAARAIIRASPERVLAQHGDAGTAAQARLAAALVHPVARGDASSWRRTAL